MWQYLFMKVIGNSNIYNIHASEVAMATNHLLAHGGLGQLCVVVLLKMNS
jgi:hypothetical protein